MCRRAVTVLVAKESAAKDVSDMGRLLRAVLIVDAEDVVVTGADHWSDARSDFSFAMTTGWAVYAS